MAVPRKPMVQWLVEKGYLKPEQYTEAQKVQQQTKTTDIGKVLADLGFVGEREVMQARAQEAGIPFVNLDQIAIDESTLRLVKETLVRNHNILPVKKDGNQLWLAMGNVTNIQAQDDVRMATGLRILPVLALPGAIEDAIRKHYAGSATNGEAKPSSSSTPSVSAPSNAAAESFTATIKQNVALAGIARPVAEDADEGIDAEGAQQGPIIKLANALIQQGIADRASDVHIEPQQKSVRVRYRVDGVLQEAMMVPRNLMAALISRFKIMADMNIAERRIPQDGRIEVRNGNKDFDLRVSSIPTPWGEKIVMRILDKSSVMIGLEKLGFTDENQLKIEEITAQPNGMFLCTGPTGSGKTTTQYSVLNKLNTVGVNILTIEDPIEYQLPGISQVQVNRKAGLNFATALRAFLRQDPDIMMVGEMRDLETAEVAIESSLTGHMVLSTLHTNDAPSATLRMIDMGVEPYLISATVIGILAQRLCRRLCPACKEPYEVRAMDLRRFGMHAEDPDQPVTLYRPVGCEECKHAGYRGRTGIHELMVMNAEIAELVVRRAPLNDIKEAAKANGMKELREDGLHKVLAGQTDPAEVMRVVFTAGY